MRSLLNLAAVAATVLPAVLATPEAGMVQFDFHKRRVPASANRLARRQTAKTVNTGITNDEYLYAINVTVGTPPQPLSLQLDTGSSDIWFPSASASYCRAGGCTAGSYNASKSSTYSNPGYGVFQIQYVDGTEVAGQYVSDSFSVGGTSLTNLTMASATQTGQQGYGIMGIGFSADESSEQGTSGFTYPNVIDVLLSEGKINTRSYSLWLDDLQSNTGSILFGGVDKSKYTGSLISIPIQKDSSSGTYTSFTVAWTGLTLTGGGQTYNESPSSAQPAILDSGTTDTLLPDSIANSIFNGVGLVTDRTYGNVVPCSLASDAMNFTFQFGGSNGPKVVVPLSEFVLPLYTTTGRVPKFTRGPYNGQTVCSFGIEAAGTNPLLFGDTFLRSAYVVYDLDNLQVGLAQSNQNSNSGTGDVKAFTSGSGMPDASTTITSVVVSASAVNSYGPQVQSSYAATTDAGDAVTTRTPTFSLTKSTASGASSSSSSAAAPVTVPSVQRSTVAVIGVTLMAFMFGTMIL